MGLIDLKEEFSSRNGQKHICQDLCLGGEIKWKTHKKLKVVVVEDLRHLHFENIKNVICNNIYKKYLWEIDMSLKFSC